MGRRNKAQPAAGKQAQRAAMPSAAVEVFSSSSPLLHDRASHLHHRPHGQLRQLEPSAQRALAGSRRHHRHAAQLQRGVELGGEAVLEDAPRACRRQPHLRVTQAAGTWAGHAGHRVQCIAAAFSMQKGRACHRVQCIAAVSTAGKPCAGGCSLHTPAGSQGAAAELWSTQGALPVSPRSTLRPSYLQLRQPPPVLSLLQAGQVEVRGLAAARQRATHHGPQPLRLCRAET